MYAVIDLFPRSLLSLAQHSTQNELDNDQKLLAVTLVNKIQNQKYIRDNLDSNQNVLRAYWTKADIMIDTNKIRNKLDSILDNNQKLVRVMLVVYNQIGIDIYMCVYVYI